MIYKSFLEFHRNIILWKKGKISRIMILKILSKQWIGGCLYANFKKRLEVVWSMCC